MFDFLRKGKLSRLQAKVKDLESKLDAVDDRGWRRIFDWTPGAFQTNHPYDPEDSVLSNPTVFACKTLIESDIGKLRPTIQQQTDGIWEEKQHKYSGLLKKPNNYQDHIQFKRAWLNSKLDDGNTYCLKIRSGMNIDSLHILDPLKVTPLVADNSDVFYRISEDRLAKLEEDQIVVPASEIIHDRFNCIFHPLIGLSPIFACGGAATMGLSMQKNSKNFFKNASSPGGILTAPGSISDATAKRIKEDWQEKFSGEKSGNVAVAGDGLTYQPMRMSNIDAQLIEHFGWSATTICGAYHVPPYKVAVGDMPQNSNIEALQQEYYSTCLQVLIEEMEASLDSGLDLDAGWRCQLDLDGLFRMDQSTLIKMLSEGIKGIIKPDEARKRLNYKKVDGGNAVFLQQQNYSLGALAKRDAKEDPFSKSDTPPAEPEIIEQANYLAWKLTQELKSA